MTNSLRILSLCCALLCGNMLNASLFPSYPNDQKCLAALDKKGTRTSTNAELRKELERLLHEGGMRLSTQTALFIAIIDLSMPDGDKPKLDFDTFDYLMQLSAIHPENKELGKIISQYTRTRLITNQEAYALKGYSPRWSKFPDYIAINERSFILPIVELLRLGHLAEKLRSWGVHRIRLAVFDRVIDLMPAIPGDLNMPVLLRSKHDEFFGNFAAGNKDRNESEAAEEILRSFRQHAFAKIFTEQGFDARTVFPKSCLESRGEMCVYRILEGAGYEIDANAPVDNYWVKKKELTPTEFHERKIMLRGIEALDLCATKDLVIITPGNYHTNDGRSSHIEGVLERAVWEQNYEHHEGQVFSPRMVAIEGVWVPWEMAAAIEYWESKDHIFRN